MTQVMLWGAPVLPLYLSDMPLTRPPVGGLLSALRSLPMREPAIEAIMRSPIGNDGIPRYAIGRIDAPSEAVFRDPDRRTGKLIGRPLWQMEAAYLVDINGSPRLELAANRGFHDFENNGHPDQVGREPRSRSFERFYTGGRKLLSTLGAWPWTHAPGGRLPRDWRSQEAFYLPLRLWWIHARDDLEGHVTWSSGVFPAGLEPPEPRRLRAV